MNDIFNDAHRWMAAETLCYRQKQLYTLPLGVSGRSTVALDCSIIEIVNYTVQAKIGGVWRSLDYCDESELVADHGPLNEVPNSDPECYYLRLGDALDQQRILEAFPGATAAVANGLELHAYVYPSLFTQDTDTPALGPAEHTRLISVMCWLMAELERSRNRPDAPVDHWYARAQEDAEKLRAIIDENRRNSPRRVRYTEDW